MRTEDPAMIPPTVLCDRPLATETIFGQMSLYAREELEARCHTVSPSLWCGTQPIVIDL